MDFIKRRLKYHLLINESDIKEFDIDEIGLTDYDTTKKEE